MDYNKCKVSKSGVYLIFSLLDPTKNYIGSAKDILFRINRHKYEILKLKHNNKKMQNYFIKYGINDMHYSILFECDISELTLHEQKYLDIYNPYFNILKKAYSLYGYKHTIESKQKIKQKNTGRKMTKEQIEKGVMSRIGQKTSKGTKRTIEQRKHISTIKKKKVIYNNIIYDSLIDLSNEIGIKYQTLYAMLSNRNYNKLNLRHYA